MKERQRKAAKREKRITKQERIRNVYAAYGIEYDIKTKKIFSPISGGMWINPALVNGNEKIGRGAYHFSTLPGTAVYHVNIAFTRKQKVCTKMVKDKKTGKKVPSKNFGKLVWYTAIDDENPIYVDVKGTCVCDCDGCYAKTGNYNYDTTLAYLAIRTLLARDYTEFLERAIRAQLTAENIKLCRIHAAGDFFNLAYTVMWKHIAIDFSDTLFWTYTKVTQFEGAFNGIENANIVKSLVSVAGVNNLKNFGPAGYIIKLYKILKAAGYRVHVCLCGMEDAAGEKTQHCTNCHSCAECEYVLFLEHSTNYNPLVDPDFPALVKLVIGQLKEERESKAA